jgi:hypothetical protein
MAASGYTPSLPDTLRVKHRVPGTFAPLQKAAQLLEEKQLITHQQGIYEVYDKFISEWLRSD